MAVGIGTPPDEDGLAHDMVFRHKAPVARVLGVVAVVTHHPVVVHLERIAVGRLAVDIDAVVFHHQLVVLIDTDGSLIDGDVVHGELESGSFLRDPDRSVVVACPSCDHVHRIEIAGDCVVDDVDAGYEILAVGEIVHSALGQRHGTALVEISQVFHGDAQIFQHVVGQVTLELDIIEVLYVVGLLVGLAIEVDDTVFDLQGLTRQTNAALDIVLAAVGGTVVDHAILHRILHDIFPSQVIDHIEVVELSLAVECSRIDGIGVLGLVELRTKVVAHRVVTVGELVLSENGVTGRIVEDHDVVELHMAKTLHAAVVPMRPLDVALGVDDGQRVLRKRHGKRCLRDTGTVAELGNKEVVAREQALLQGTRRDDVVLESEEVDEVHGHEGEDQRVDPAHDEAHGTLGVLPPGPANLLGDIVIEDERDDDQSQPALHPQEEEQIEGSDHAKLDPLLLHVHLSFFLIDHFFCYWITVLELKQIARGEQSLMVFGELSGEHGTEGKALAAVSVVGDGDAVGLRVVRDGMDAGHLVVADAVDKQLVGLVVLSSVDMSVVPYGGAGLPRCLAVEVVDDILRQGDGGARRCVELMDMMGFGHLHVVLWELVHDFGQILIDGREDRHANGEVAGPKERLLAVLAECLHIGLVVFHPAGGAAHHLDVVGKSAQIVAVGSRGVCELYGDVGRRKGGAVEVVLIVAIFMYFRN